MKKATIYLVLTALLLPACGDQRSVHEESLDTEEIQYPLPPSGGKIEYENHGEEQWFAYGALSGVDETPANGVAQAHLFEDGHYVHTVQVNLIPADEGYFYEGWLVRGNDVISTGRLNNAFGDARHSLRYETDADFHAYTNVIITLEPDDGDPAPAKHVAQGVMKVTKRK